MACGTLLSLQVRLAELNLWAHDFSAEGARALAGYAMSPAGSALAALRLGRNAGLCAAGAMALGPMLARSASLRALSLSSCAVGPAGARAFGRALASNPSLFLGAHRSLAGGAGRFVARTLDLIRHWPFGRHT